MRELFSKLFGSGLTGFIRFRSTRARTARITRIAKPLGTRIADQGVLVRISLKSGSVAFEAQSGQLNWLVDLCVFDASTVFLRS